MTDQELRQLAQDGNSKIEQAILCLLQNHAEGLTNAEIVNILKLTSSYNGGHRNYLIYSVLGNLMEAKKVYRDDMARPKYHLTT